MTPLLISSKAPRSETGLNNVEGTETCEVQKRGHIRGKVPDMIFMKENGINHGNPFDLNVYK